MAPPAHRTERLLNLVICLLSTRSWLTKEQIRAAVPQYAECATTEAFDRMFERDKEDLRELGVPLVTGSHSSWFEDEQGYRIDRGAYALPDLEFSAEELAVLGLASRVWQQASLAGPAARALVKLKALGVETDDESLVGVEPKVRAAEPAFEPLYAATRDRAAAANWDELAASLSPPSSQRTPARVSAAPTTVTTTNVRTDDVLTARCPGCGPVGGDRNSRYCPACLAGLRRQLQALRRR